MNRKRRARLNARIYHQAFRFITSRIIPIHVVGDLDIRQYTPPDAERVLTVYELAIEAHGWEFGDEIPPYQEVTDCFLSISENYLDDGGEFLVGLRDDRIMATGGFKSQDDFTAEIGKMAVHPDHQRRGYCERVLIELEGRAENGGFDRPVLETFESLSVARRLYEKYGYEEPRREFDDEFSEHRIYYRKDL